jgi:hypothetical protein
MGFPGGSSDAAGFTVPSLEMHWIHIWGEAVAHTEHAKAVTKVSVFSGQPNSESRASELVDITTLAR